jgi:hypothetical protein
MAGTYRSNHARTETLRPKKFSGREILAETLCRDNSDVRIGALINNLSSDQPLRRINAAKLLKEYVSDVERAREILPILPPDDPAYRSIFDVRIHCIQKIRNSLKR